MRTGLVGIKLGMSRIFNAEGRSLPVTVVHAKSNIVCQVKKQDKEGYSSVQIAIGEQKPQRLSKALRGHYAKNKVPVSSKLIELRIDQEQESEFKPGDKIGVSQFIKGQKVDATGISKGKGFSGTIKRWNFSAQDATHGNSISHRHPGSTGQCQFPGKVWKGKKMAGQYGNKRSTVQRLEVAMIDEENELLLIKGAIPGGPGCTVMVRHSVKETLAERTEIEKKLEESLAAQAEKEAQEQEAKEEKQAEESATEEPKPENTGEESAAQEVAKEEKQAEESATEEPKPENTSEESAAQEAKEEKQAEESATEEPKPENTGKESAAQEVAKEEKQAEESATEEPKPENTGEESTAQEVAREEKQAEESATEEAKPEDTGEKSAAQEEAKEENSKSSEEKATEEEGK